MSAPNYSPVSGKGTVVGAPEGNYMFNGTTWNQISSAMPTTTAPVTKTVPIAPTVPTTSTPQSQGTQIPSQSDNSALLNAAYDPIFSELDNQDTQTRADQIAAEQNADSQKALLLNQAETNSQPVFASIDQAGQQEFNANRSAIADAIRMYSSKLQQNSQLFGGQSGTGQAINDILGQQLLRNQGNISTTHLNNIQTLSNQVIQAHAYLASTKDQIEQSALAQKEALDKEFRNQLTNIHNQRASAQSSKEQQQLQLTTQYQQAIQTLQLNRVNAEAELKDWFLKESQTAADQLNLLQKQIAANPTQSQNSPTFSDINGNTNTIINGIQFVYNPKTGGWDPYKGLINATQ